MKNTIAILKTTYREWQEENASRFAAAVAYYTILSLFPLPIVVLARAALSYGN